METTIKDIIYVTIDVDTLRKGMRLYIDYAKNYAELNCKPIEMDTHLFYRRLVSIVSRWEHDMGGHNTLDGIAYCVKIEKDGKEYVYKGRNRFPFNFGSFMDLLAEYKLW